jgi:hypothetical protein
MSSKIFYINKDVSAEITGFNTQKDAIAVFHVFGHKVNGYIRFIDSAPKDGKPGELLVSIGIKGVEADAVTFVVWQDINHFLNLAKNGIVEILGQAWLNGFFL